MKLLIPILTFLLCVGLTIESVSMAIAAQQGSAPAPAVAPALDALDKRAIDHTVALSVDAQTACDALTVSKRFAEAQQVANYLIEGRYPGYRYDWGKKALVLKAAK